MGKGAPKLCMRWMGGHRFPIYWMDNQLPVSGFDYDKLDSLEIRALAILDAFRVVKVKDLLNMVDDPEQISNFLGNVYMYLTIL